MEGQQRIGVMIRIPQVLREMGKDPAQVIAGAGIDPERLLDPEGSLTFVEVGKLLHACVSETGCDHFGIMVGQRSSTADLGLVGRLMRNAPTLKSAMLDLCTNQRRYVRGAVAYLLVENETAFWGYAVHHPTMLQPEQLSEGAIATAFSLLRELAGLPPNEVLIARKAPGDIAPYRQFFGYTPTFNAAQYAVAFPASLLTQPVRGADRELRRKLEKSIADYWTVTQPTIAQSMVRLLHARVVFPDATLEALASELSMHPRTLTRRLQAEGTSFRELVNEVRYSVSRQLLAGTRMEVADIALALGYADPSGFTHAFQRWSGMAPIDWRRKERSLQLAS